MSEKAAFKFLLEDRLAQCLDLVRSRPVGPDTQAEALAWETAILHIETGLKDVREQVEAL